MMGYRTLDEVWCVDCGLKIRDQMVNGTRVALTTGKQLGAWPLGQVDFGRMVAGEPLHCGAGRHCENVMILQVDKMGKIERIGCWLGNLLTEAGREQVLTASPSPLANLRRYWYRYAK